MAQGRATRNQKVEAAVRAALNRIDDFTAGQTIGALPPAELRRACDGQLARPGSTRLASLFFTFYSLQDPDWDYHSIPIGIRGTYGDKLFGEQLTRRGITLHDAVVAFAENLGWKGNVRTHDLRRDEKFRDFAAMLAGANESERHLMADYLASRFADSRQVIAPLPAVGANVLTFARAKDLFFKLLKLNTEGHVPQFLVAAILHVYRARFGVDVRTHHPHAADKFDRTAGDIEEWLNGELIRAYEVTVRDDWKNRLSGFRDKMDRFGLPKYVIIAAGVNADEQLRVPARLLAFVQVVERDLAIVDIEDFCVVFAAELTASQLREVVNQTYDYLCNPKLCGRAEFQAAYRDVVDKWLDSAG